MGKNDRLKRARKTLQWYSQHWGFQTPLRIVLSADFITTCVANNKRIETILHSLFGETVIIETTRCTIHSLPYPAAGGASGGSDGPNELARRIAGVARSFSLAFQCRHQHLGPEGTPMYSSSDCLAKIRETPKSKVAVATTDFHLFFMLKGRGWVPLVSSNAHAQLALASIDKTKTLKTDARAVVKFNRAAHEVDLLQEAQREERRLERQKQARRFAEERQAFAIPIRKKKRVKEAKPLSSKRTRASTSGEDVEGVLISSEVNPLLVVKKQRKRIRKGARKRAAIAKAAEATSSSSSPT